MTDQSIPRSRAADRSLSRVFIAPTIITIASIVGLIAALIGDGVLDVIGWMGLGAPVAVSLWFVYLKNARRENSRQS